MGKVDSVLPEIRGYRASDLERIEQIHKKQGLDYAMPRLSDPTFAIGAVASDSGVQMAGFAKITAEMFLFLDHDYADPETRWKLFLALHESVRRQAIEAGLQDLNFWLPPGVPEGFIRKLMQIGWSENTPWRQFTFNLR